MKKLTAFLLIIIMLSVSVNAYYFPEPDWGALLKKREAMVNETDFELYAEGGLESAVYYGARLEPKEGVYIGMTADSAENFKPIGAYLTYLEGMSRTDLYYPSSYMVKEDNVVTMVGWTIESLYSVDYNHVRNTLNTLNSYKKPMFIRFANEMNVSSLGDNPDEYIRVFRTIADMVHEYPNFAVVWSPNDMGALDRPFSYYYPGDEYVDWVGISCYPVKYFMGNKNTKYNDTVFFMTGENAWTTNKIKPIIEFMQENNINKPVMISEGGVPTNNKFGENLESWGAPRMRNMMFNAIMKYPQIKMINYFNTNRATENERYDISDYPYACDIFKEARDCGAYITDTGKKPHFVFQPATKSGVLTAKNNKINLYTLAHLPGYETLTVNYYIDGEWCTMSDKAPYKCELNISSISDGAHTLKILAYDKTEEYTFYKHNNQISFGGDFEGIQEKITVTVNGKTVEFDTEPIIKEGRTLVPLRAIFEALNAEVEWIEKTKTIISKKDGITIINAIENNEMEVNGNKIILEVPPQLINGRTLVPVRAISEAFGCSVEWDGEKREVRIIS